MPRSTPSSATAPTKPGSRWQVSRRRGKNGVQIAIASARPGALFGWIARLESAGILVDSLSTTDNGDKTVSVQMTLKARGS